MKRRVECLICGTQRDLDGRCRIRTCRRCQAMTPHAEIGFVAGDDRFFGYRNLGDLLELVLADPEQRASEWETELASRAPRLNRHCYSFLLASAEREESA